MRRFGIAGQCAYIRAVVARFRIGVRNRALVSESTSDQGDGGYGAASTAAFACDSAASMYHPITAYQAGDAVTMPDPRKNAPRFRDVDSALEISDSRSNSADARNVEEGPLLPVKHHHHQHQQQQQQRLVSLDVFRGLTVALMIFVDDAGGVLPAINHSPWDGLTLADLVMPFFLFIVGVALALAYKKLSCRSTATRKAVFRFLKLFALGLFLQGGYFHGINNLTYGVNVEQMRLMGILQRIAIAYLLAAVSEIWLKGDGSVTTGSSLLRKYRYQLAVTFVLIVLYLSLSYGLYVPDWEYQIATGSSALKKFYVNCGVRGDTTPACNAVGMIDRKILGIQHLYKRPIYARTQQCSINAPDHGPLPPDAPVWCQAPFDPEGILSSVMGIVTCLVGLHYGHIILHFKDHRDRILHWMIPSSSLLVLGLTLDLVGMHINKPLYSFSYMCVTSGAAGVLFVGIYLMVDICGRRRTTLVFEWMGRHALFIFVVVACNVLPVVLQGFYWRRPENNILRLIGIGS